MDEQIERHTHRQNLKIKWFGLWFFKNGCSAKSASTVFFMKGQDLQRMWSILTPKTPTASKGDWKKIQ